MKIGKDILKNINLLYVISFVSILNIITLAQSQQTNKILLILAAGLITHSFNKNMIVVLGSTLLISLLLMQKNMEGMENPVDENEKNYTPVNDVIQDDDAPIVIDESANIEASYKNLQNFLDSPSFNKLTEETNKLAKSQNKLMSSLSTLTPVLKEANASIGNLDLSTYGALSEVITSMGKKNKT